jgi:hypothetical protein
MAATILQIKLAGDFVLRASVATASGNDRETVTFSVGRETRWEPTRRFQRFASS